MRRVTRSSTRQAEAAEAAEAANDPPDLLQIAAALSVVVAQHAIIRGMLDSKGLAALRACGKLGKAAVDPNIRVLKAPARRVLPAAKSLSADWCHVRYLNLSDISHHTPDASVLRFFTQLRTMHCMAAMRASLKAVSVRVQSLDGALKVVKALRSLSGLTAIDLDCSKSVLDGSTLRQLSTLTALDSLSAQGVCIDSGPSITLQSVKQLVCSNSVSVCEGTGLQLPSLCAGGVEVGALSLPRIGVGADLPDASIQGEGLGVKVTFPDLDAAHVSAIQQGLQFGGLLRRAKYIQLAGSSEDEYLPFHRIAGFFAIAPLPPVQELDLRELEISAASLAVLQDLPLQTIIFGFCLLLAGAGAEAQALLSLAGMPSLSCVKVCGMSWHETERDRWCSALGQLISRAAEARSAGGRAFEIVLQQFSDGQVQALEQHCDVAAQQHSGGRKVVTVRYVALPAVP